MFTRKEKNMLFDPYFEVIRETEQFIEVRSVNTGHCWSVFKNIYNAPRKITLYHKHKESDRYFHQHRVYRTVVDAVSEIKSHDKYVLEEKTKQRESPAQTERRLKVHESSGYKYTKEILTNFIIKLEDLTGEQTEFREELWGGLVDHIRIDEKSSTIVFRGGIEITI